MVLKWERVLPSVCELCRAETTTKYTLPSGEIVAVHGWNTSNKDCVNKLMALRQKEFENGNKD